MKRILLSSAMVAALAGTAAHAQLPDITGQVTGTVDQTTRLGVDSADRSAAIDQRTGLALDARLTGQLERTLTRYDRAGANTSLRSLLDTETHAYARAGTPPPPRARASARVQYAPVRVYTRDGYYVGRVDRTRRSSGQHYVVIRPEGRSRTHAVLASQAAFDAQANAVILTATQAELGSQMNIYPWTSGLLREAALFLARLDVLAHALFPAGQKLPAKGLETPLGNSRAHACHQVLALSTKPTSAEGCEHCTYPRGMAKFLWSQQPYVDGEGHFV